MRIKAQGILLSPILLALSMLVSVPAVAVSEIAPNPTVPQFQNPQTPAPFDGTWEGKIFFDKEAFLVATSTPAEGTVFRIQIHDPIVRAFIQESDGGFTEFKAGAFHIAAVDTNAAIFATDSDPGAWVETWTFAVTQKDANTLIVEYSRIVNNVGLMPDDPSKIFGTRGTGVFKRVAP